MNKDEYIEYRNAWKSCLRNGFEGMTIEDKEILRRGYHAFLYLSEFDLPGFKAAFWRWVGLRFGRETWRFRGVEMRNLVKELSRNIAEAKIEKTDKEKTNGL